MAEIEGLIEGIKYPSCECPERLVESNIAYRD